MMSTCDRLSLTSFENPTRWHDSHNTNEWSTAPQGWDTEPYVPVCANSRKNMLQSPDMAVWLCFSNVTVIILLMPSPPVNSRTTQTTLNWHDALVNRAGSSAAVVKLPQQLLEDLCTVCEHERYCLHVYISVSWGLSAQLMPPRSRN